MSIQPVELNKAYRLLQIGPTTMISAKNDGIENVMAAAWVGLVGNNKVMAFIGPQAFTRGLVEKSGYYVVQIPVVNQMDMVLYAGGNSYSDTPDKNSKIPLFYQKEFDLRSYLMKKMKSSTTCLWGKLSEHGVMTAFSEMGTGFLMMRQMNYVLSIT